MNNKLKRFLFYRDNGISIQISVYQLYTEFFRALLILLYIISGKSSFLSQIMGFFNSTMVYIIQPLFYLHGDVNFRKRVSNHGLCEALKKELFEINADFIHVQSIMQRNKINQIVPIVLTPYQA